MVKIGKIDEGVIHPRHMMCPAYNHGSDRCRGCHHRVVHEEALDCKEEKMLGCPACRPVKTTEEE
jgi:hypothetical protein